MSEILRMVVRHQIAGLSLYWDRLAKWRWVASTWPGMSVMDRVLLRALLRPFEPVNQVLVTPSVMNH